MKFGKLKNNIFSGLAVVLFTVFLLIGGSTRVNASNISAIRGFTTCINAGSLSFGQVSNCVSNTVSDNRDVSSSNLGTLMAQGLTGLSGTNEQDGVAWAEAIAKLNGLASQVNDMSPAELENERLAGNTQALSFFTFYNRPPENDPEIPPETTSEETLVNTFRNFLTCVKIIESGKLEDLNHCVYNAQSAGINPSTLATWLTNPSSAPGYEAETDDPNISLARPIIDSLKPVWLGLMPEKILDRSINFAVRFMDSYYGKPRKPLPTVPPTDVKDTSAECQPTVPIDVLLAKARGWAAAGVPTVETGPLLNIIANFPIIKICKNIDEIKMILAAIKVDTGKIEGETNGLLKIAQEFRKGKFVDDPDAIAAAKKAIRDLADEYKEFKKTGRTDLLGADGKSFTPTASNYEAEMKEATAKQIYAAVEENLKNNETLSEFTKKQILDQLDAQVKAQSPEINTKINQVLSSATNVYDAYANVQAIFDYEVTVAGERARATLAGSGGVAPVLKCHEDSFITTADGIKICPPTRAQVLTPADEIKAIEEALAISPIKQLEAVQGKQDYNGVTPQADSTRAAESIVNNASEGSAIGGNRFSSSGGRGGGGSGGPSGPPDPRGPKCVEPSHDVIMSVAPLNINGLKFSKITWSSADMLSCTATTDWVSFDNGPASPSILFANGAPISLSGTANIQHPSAFVVSVSTDDSDSDGNNLPPPPEQIDIKNKITAVQTRTVRGVTTPAGFIQTTEFTPTMRTIIPASGFDQDDTISLTIAGRTATTRAFGSLAPISANEIVKNMETEIKNGPSATVSAFRDYEVTVSGSKLIIKNKNPIPGNVSSPVRYEMACSYKIKCGDGNGTRTRNVTVNF